MTWRRVGIALGGLAIALVAAAVASAAALFGPFLLDDRALDRAVLVVALDWRDFGEEKARERLQLELDAGGIGLQVQDDDCQLLTDGADRYVRCAWDTVVVLPMLEREVPLAFSSEAHLAADGTVN